jgi:hypothetical protein
MMVDKEWLEEYKSRISDLWHSEYPEEGEPQANIQEVILECIRSKSKENFHAQLVNVQLDDPELEELDEQVMTVLAGEHFANKLY